jgi:spermidine synthase
MQQAAESWGRDVGRLAAWNTLGACLGTLAMTFIGYEIPFFMMALTLALLMYAMQEYVVNADHSLRWLTPAAAAVAVVAGSLIVDPSRVLLSDRLYSGRDGAIFITPDKQVLWDGLWHSQLSENGNHIGTNNWYLGVCPVISHQSGDIRDVCVIGVCTGITVGTLAKLDTVERIDGYDITHVLKRIYADYPDGTLNIATNPKVNLRWQDARTGLTLDPRKYDLIQTQPLYLMQSGSAQLNSVEFFRLISQRLKPGGVFCLYSNGMPEQAFAVRETAAKVFPHRESFLNGYLVICSNDPIDLSEATLAKRLERDDPLWREIRGYAKTATAAEVLKLVDRPRLETGDGDLAITDDFPIVEYPRALAERLRAKQYPFRLPDPR